MYLQRLAITGLRNLDSVDIALGPGANLFHGANGSGKTSVLEAVYLLSRGRSFRTRSLRSVINHQRRDCTCFGGLEDDLGVKPSLGIGVSRGQDGEFIFKVGGEQVRSAAELTEALPVQLLNSDSFQLLEGSPSHRRSFLDWGVFHVEHNYRHLWSRFQRCLKHRNSLLRHGRIDPLQLAVWDREFVLVSNQISEFRSKYLSTLLPVFEDVCLRLGVSGGLKLTYVAGWDLDVGLERLLQAGLERDQKSGHTQAGPHRGDLKIQLGGRMASEVLSRGQTKILITALKIAQGYLLRSITGRQCIYLLDDLPAELDLKHRQLVGHLLADLGVQVLITGVDADDLRYSWPDMGDRTEKLLKVFHVEQGCIQVIE